MRIIGSIALVLSAVVWAAPASAEIAISRKDCSRLVNHEPAPDVTYLPGVDVHGRPVVPADLGGPRLTGVDQLPDVIYIPIEVLVQDKYGIPANSVLYDATALIGVVSVRGNRVYFEDQELTDPEVAALEQACRDRGFN
jgi:hypothetical protein